HYRPRSRGASTSRSGGGIRRSSRSLEELERGPADVRELDPHARSALASLRLLAVDHMAHLTPQNDRLPTLGEECELAAGADRIEELGFEVQAAVRKITRDGVERERVGQVHDRQVDGQARAGAALR